MIKYARKSSSCPIFYGLVVLFLILLFAAPSHGQKIESQLLSDEYLLTMGLNAYDDNHFLNAAVYLYAYVQREGSQLNDAAFRKQLYRSLNYSLQNAGPGKGVAGVEVNFNFESSVVNKRKPELRMPTQTLNRSRIQSGEWSCNDGGIYFIRIDGNKVWWYGQGSTFANVMFGFVDETEGIITGNWVSLPLSGDSSGGTIAVRIVNSKQLQLIRKTGDLQAQVWKRR